MWGRRVKVAPGPAALARAANTPLIPVFIFYERIHGKRRREAGSKWGLVLRFAEPIEPTSVSGPEAVAELTQIWAAWMATQIAEEPQDWHMLQRLGWVE